MTTETMQAPASPAQRRRRGVPAPAVLDWVARWDLALWAHRVKFAGAAKQAAADGVSARPRDLSAAARAVCTWWKKKRCPRPSVARCLDAGEWFRLLAWVRVHGERLAACGTLAGGARWATACGVRCSVSTLREALLAARVPVPASTWPRTECEAPAAAGEGEAVRP